MKKTSLSLGMAGLLALLTGCANGPGPYPAETAPRLTQHGEHRHWDSGHAFGPVPADMAQVLAQRCERLNTAETSWQAQGYHPGALDLQGKPFAKGGVLCRSEKKA